MLCVALPEAVRLPATLLAAGLPDPPRGDEPAFTSLEVTRWWQPSRPPRLAVPAPAVQDVVDRAVEAGVRGILNFAPAQLKVPEEVALKDVNMVMELEALSFTLSQGEEGR